MKKALNISIAQTLFTIEEDAYAKLESYFQSIRAHFAQTEGKEEIISDIESRISEQLADTKKTIITLADIELVIASMGRVEDFGDSEDKQSVNAPSTEKKLYRDPDDKIIAGVCSGLGAYTNIDPLWLRIAFVIFTVTTSGFGALVYIILALILPEAKTASQKLEMQGSPVTLETMSENITDKVQTLRARHESKIKTILSWPFEVLKALVDITVTYIGPFLRTTLGASIALLSLAVILCLSILAPVILTNTDVHFDFPISHIVSMPLLYASVIGIYLACVIPLAVLLIAGLSIALKRSYLNTTLLFTLLFFWSVAIVGSGVSTANALQRLNSYSLSNPLYEEITRDLAVSQSITTLAVENGIRVTYVQGETPQLTASGRTRLLDNLIVEEREETLTLGVRESSYFCLFCSDEPLEVVITLPQLETIQAEDGARVTADSWTSNSPVTIEVARGVQATINVTSPEVKAIAEHGSRLTVETDTDQVLFNIQHGSRLFLEGTAENADLSAKHGSIIDFSEAEVQTVQATAGYGSRITLDDITTLNASAQYGSRIEYRGNPEVTKEADSGSLIVPIYGVN